MDICTRVYIWFLHINFWLRLTSREAGLIDIGLNINIAGAYVALRIQNGINFSLAYDNEYDDMWILVGFHTFLYHVEDFTLFNHTIYSTWDNEE